MSEPNDEHEAGAPPEPEPAPDAPGPAPAPPREEELPQRGSAREALLASLGVTVLVAGALSAAFDPARAGTLGMLIVLGLCYALLGGLTILRLHQRGELGARLRPASGDVTLGAVTAGVLYGLTRVVAMFVAPRGSPQEGWLISIYGALGDPSAPGHRLVSFSVLAIAALEEITWRGLVMRSQESVLGSGRALLFSSTLFAIAHLPTAYLLRAPNAGYNPLLVMAGAGCSLVWGLILLRTRRLLPAIFAHAVYSWAIVEFPVWRP